MRLRVPVEVEYASELRYRNPPMSPETLLLAITQSGETIDTLAAMRTALSLGMDVAFDLHTPLMTIDKADTWRMSEDLGGEALVDLIVRTTHSCYRGARSPVWPWGAGCGECPACALRAAGWRRYRGEAA